MRSALLLVLSFLLLPLASCVQVGPTPEQYLAELIAMRLSIAEEVAWSKHNTGASVLDPEREASLLASLVKQGVKAGLQPEQVRAFFIPQMAASRQLQTENLSAWASLKPKPTTPPLDLQKDIRPKMEKISRELILFLSEKSPGDLNPEEVFLHLQNRGFSEDVISLAVTGVSDFKKASQK